MKKLIVFSLFIWTAVTVQAQQLKDRDVPEVVKATLMEKFPKATKVTWENEDGMYVGEFSQDNREMEIVIAADGKFAMTEEEIEISELPGGALTYIGVKLEGNKAIKAERIVDALNNISYEVESGDVDYFFDVKGNFLFEEKSSDTTEDKSGEDR